MKIQNKIGWFTATGIVVSNMVGTGVFTSLGFQLLAVSSTWNIVLLWVLGGVLALIGAFTFAELGTHYNRTGGDYVFISEAFHPLLGYLSAWTSLIVGFSAPVAIAAIAMEAYLQPFQIPNLRLIIVLIVICICFFHTKSIKFSAIFQNATTFLKAVFVLALLIIGLVYAANPANGLHFQANSAEVFKPSFAVSLLYVTYAYTGWNAAAYIVGEIKEPAKNLPKALILGTILVTIIYVALQLIFLKFATQNILIGKAEVALVAIESRFGNYPAKMVSLGIAIQLIATMSSYVWIGSRVVHSMAQNFSLWRILRPTNANGVPTRTIWLLCGIIILLIFSGSLNKIMLYTSFLLQLMGTLAIASIFKAKRKLGTFHAPFRPFLQIFYVIFSLFVLGFIAYDKPKESLIGLGILGLGLITYFMSDFEKHDPTLKPL